MTPEAQRIAIAEACGIEEIEFINAVNGGWFGSDINGDSVDVPDYLNDLNAMHSAVEHAEIDDRRWSTALMNVIRDDPAWTSGTVEARYRTAKATASQRAEAFLKTIGKWKPISGAGLTRIQGSEATKTRQEGSA
jgi:hypothetical protein